MAVQLAEKSYGHSTTPIMTINSALDHWATQCIYTTLDGKCQPVAGWTALWHAWSGALTAAAGPKGKGSGDAMQDRPLRCQHGRRWSQSGRGWQGYMLRHLRDC